MSKILFAFLLIFSFIAKADDYHYKDLLIGERAIGLGGSYIAIADDPSGMWYNPAGIIFSFENYFSLSANAYLSTSEVYKNVLKGNNYSYASSNLVPNFFGFTQNYDKWKWGFGIVVPNSDLYDQDDQFDDLSAVAGKVKSFQRRFYRQNTTTSIGLAAATEVKKNLTIGLSVFGNYHVDKTISNQLIVYNANSPNLMTYHFDNGYLTKNVFSVSPKLGMQWMPTKSISVGAVVSKKFTLSGSQKLKSYKNTLNGTGDFPADPTGNVDADLQTATTTGSTKDLSPLELGFGLAYFPDKVFLLTSDFIFYTSDTAYLDFDVQPTWNWSLGGEYYLSDKSVIRGGFYTNNANTPKLLGGSINQPTHVDMYGLTCSYSLISPGSSFAFGVNYATGNGAGQIIGGSTAQQDVTRNSIGVFLTGSYQM